MRACRGELRRRRAERSRTGWYETRPGTLLTAELVTARVHCDNFRHPSFRERTMFENQPRRPATALSTVFDFN